MREWKRDEWERISNLGKEWDGERCGTGKGEGREGRRRMRGEEWDDGERKGMKGKERDEGEGVG